MKTFNMRFSWVIALLAVFSPNVFADNNQRLWYDAPAKIWLEALPLGNGKMGAMVYGGCDTEEIQLNETTFWSGGPHDNNSPSSIYHLNEVRSLIFDGKAQQAEQIINREFVKGPHGMRFLPAGSLKLNFGHQNVSDYQRELDLQKAVNTVSYTSGGVKYTRTAFAPLHGGIVVLHIRASRKGALSFSVEYDSVLPATSVATDGSLEATVQGADQEGIKGALTAVCKTTCQTDGKLSHTDKTLVISGATEATLFISASTNFVNYHDVSGDARKQNDSLLATAEQIGIKKLLANHIRDYQTLYNRVHFTLPQGQNASLPTNQRLDKFYESDDMSMVSLLFNYGRYLLVSASQPGAQPANLQGIWNDKRDAPWDAKYTININTEMNYWPAEVCNISETAEPLFSMVRDLSVTGAQTARTMYGCRGWVAHHNTDLWRIAGPVDGAFWGMFPNGGAWLSTHLWEHYLFTRDEDFLRNNYALLLGAAQFYLDYMVEHDGQLLVVPSVSPEHGGKGSSTPICAGCTMDNQIVRDALTQAILASQVLQRDSVPSIAQMSAALAKLPPMKVGQYGQLQEWIQDIDDPNDQHRHISHLYGLYPSHQISPITTPELWKAAGVTLQQRGDEATGWSLGWKTCFWARMMDGNHAFRIISNMLRLLPGEDGESMKAYPHGRTFPNLFDAHPPFQIDGNFGVTAGIAEMLLQSTSSVQLPQQDSDIIHLLPALPEAWSQGSISGLKARGGHTVSITWKDGKLSRATILPAHSGTLVIRTSTPLISAKPVKTYTQVPVYEYQFPVQEGIQLEVR